MISDKLPTNLRYWYIFLVCNPWFLNFKMDNCWWWMGCNHCLQTRGSKFWVSSSLVVQGLKLLPNLLYSWVIISLSPISFCWKFCIYSFLSAITLPSWNSCGSFQPAFSGFTCVLFSPWRNFSKFYWLLWQGYCSCRKHCILQCVSNWLKKEFVTVGKAHM